MPRGVKRAQGQRFRPCSCLFVDGTPEARVTEHETMATVAKVDLKGTIRTIRYMNLPFGSILVYI